MTKKQIHERIKSALAESNLKERLKELRSIYHGVTIRNKPYVQVLIDNTMELMGLSPE